MLVTSGATVATLALPVQVPRWRLCAPQGSWWRSWLTDFGQLLVQLPLTCCRRLGLRSRSFMGLILLAVTRPALAL